ncbi:MAG: glycosyltransferase [Lachnospiraceae bacterium]|nr:glycosyltransferase [Lachnospiraceae bacterium]
MRVVHFSTTDYGGAYRAAERISECMKSVGIDSFVVVRTRNGHDTLCYEYFKTPVGRFISKVKNVINLILSSGELITDLFGTDVSRSGYVKEADVVVLHWVNSFISYRDVRRLADTGKKIIWVLHDEWVYTEGYHLTSLRSDSPGLYKRLLTKYNIKQKTASYTDRNITFVAVSEWMKKQALISDILKNERVLTIHNPLDTEKFQVLREPVDHYNSGKRKIILFGADKATYNTNKGFSYLIEALQKLDGSKYIAVCFGNAPESSRIRLDNIEIVYTGTISNDDELINLYNLADVMVVPSIQEAFGYTCCEALACGTPVVGFDTSGLKDQIVHRKNGYLARLRDPDDLLQGILYCLDNKEELSIMARETAVANNSYKVIGNEYKKLL